MKKTKNATAAPAAAAPPRRPAATVDSFQNLQARLGYGAGNQADWSDYQVDYISRNRYRLEAMYRSSWICGKAVDTVAEDMTKQGIELNSVIDPKDSDQIHAAWKRMKIWEKLSEVIKWARLYGGALGVLLIDGQDPATPLRIETVKRGQFKGIFALDRWTVTPSFDTLVTEFGPEMGLPKFYSVVADSLALKRAKIHYSRVIRVEGQDLPYWQRIAEQLWGQSILERLWDRLLAFDSTTQGAAQLCYKAHLRTYKIEGLRDLIAAGGPMLNALVKQMEFTRATQTNEGLTLVDSKDEFETHQYTFAGLDAMLLQFGQQLSGAVDIPLTRLFGQSPAGLNATGESDIRNYYDGIKQQQESRLRAGVGTLLALTSLSELGRPLPPDSDFTFRPLWQLSETEKASIASTVAGAVNTVFAGGMIGQQTALKELRQSSHLTGIFTNISNEAIEAATDETQPLGELAGEDPFGKAGEDEGKPGDKKAA